MMRSPHFALSSALLVTCAAAIIGMSHVGAASDSPLQMPGPVIHEPVGQYNGFTYVGRVANRGDDTTTAHRTSTFVVTYNGFTPQAQAAFQYAVDVWSSIVSSPVPIRVTAYWRTDMPPYVLGSAGAASVVRDFPNAPRANTYYPAALANARAGYDVSSSEEIVATFNGNFPWYLGTDGNARDTFDFATVVLHELGHGLGLFSSMRVENGNGVWGLGGPAAPMAYDTFMTDAAGQSLLNPQSYANASAQLAAALVSNDVGFEGPAARVADKRRPLIFAPSPFVPGSSISHLSDSAYPNGDANSLMTPAIGPGEVVHDPGPIVIGMLADMGWPMVTQAANELPPNAPQRLRLIGFGTR